MCGPPVERRLKSMTTTNFSFSTLVVFDDGPVIDVGPGALLWWAGVGKDDVYELPKRAFTTTVHPLLEKLGKPDKWPAHAFNTCRAAVEAAREAAQRGILVRYARAAAAQ